MQEKAGVLEDFEEFEALKSENKNAEALNNLIKTLNTFLEKSKEKLGDGQEATLKSAEALLFLENAHAHEKIFDEEVEKTMKSSLILQALSMFLGKDVIKSALKDDGIIGNIASFFLTEEGANAREGMRKSMNEDFLKKYEKDYKTEFDKPKIKAEGTSETPETPENNLLADVNKRWIDTNTNRITPPVTLEKGKTSFSVTVKSPQDALALKHFYAPPLDISGMGIDALKNLNSEEGHKHIMEQQKSLDPYGGVKAEFPKNLQVKIGENGTTVTFSWGQKGVLEAFKEFQEKKAKK
jgi:hypothetical protein